MISATAVALFAACKPDPVYPEECPREDAAALQAAFEADSLGVVRSGACDAHERVVDCPAWREVRDFYRGAMRQWALCGGQP